MDTTSERQLIDLYGAIDEVSLTFVSSRVSLEFVLDAQQVHEFTFRRPTLLEPFVRLFDGGWYGMRVFDTRPHTQCEGGRYRVEFWDEDDPFSTVLVDDFDHVQSPITTDMPRESQ